jgi:SET domain-containing protein
MVAGSLSHVYKNDLALLSFREYDYLLNSQEISNIYHWMEHSCDPLSVYLKNIYNIVNKPSISCDLSFSQLWSRRILSPGI